MYNTTATRYRDSLQQNNEPVSPRFNGDLLLYCRIVGLSMLSNCRPCSQQCCIVLWVIISQGPALTETTCSHKSRRRARDITATGHCFLSLYTIMWKTTEHLVVIGRRVHVHRGRLRRYLQSVNETFSSSCSCGLENKCYVIKTSIQTLNLCY